VTHIRVDRLEGVGVLTLDRGSRHNSLDVPTAQELRRAGLELARDEAVRAVVVRGLPGVFCSGVDLKYVAEGGHPPDLAYLRPAGGEETGPGAVFKQTLEYLNATISEIRRAPKPFLAAVDGVAAAGGLGLALACDLVLASERASFEWAYGKTGLSGAESATFLLPRLVGLGRAMHLALLSPRLDARAAERIGLVAEVWPVGEFEERIAETARRLAAGPAAAFARMKRLMNRAAGLDDLEAHLDAEAAELVASAQGEEFSAGLARFLARRREPEGR
jgi:2-(1,2-epoxy-1,2-dihydrophenyl)acetyl-CoA isomerase